jgi:hypothetical protein
MTIDTLAIMAASQVFVLVFAVTFVVAAALIPERRES